MRSKPRVYLFILIFVVTALSLKGQTSQTTLVVVTNIVSSSPTLDLTVRLPQQPSAPANPFKDYSAIIAALLAVVGVAVTACFTMRRGRKDAQFAYAAEMMNFRLKQVQEFYAPLEVLVEQSHQVYNKFLEILETVQPPIAKKDFRLLDHIWELQKDKTCGPLIEQILAIGSKITTLIVTQAGLIEGGTTPVFKEYVAHYSILTAASKQELTAEQKEKIKKTGYYTRTLNREIHEGYKIVLAYLSHYAKASDRIISNLIHVNLLDIGLGRDELITNLRYYEAHAKEYAAKFDGFDFSQIQNRFVEGLEYNHETQGLRKILDVGCGTGRDTEWFIKKGFAVTAIDFSPAMLRFCRDRVELLKSAPQTAVSASGSNCIEMTFDEISFVSEFDGIWASASLLHVSNDKLYESLCRLVKATKNGGLIYLSLKHGSGGGEYGGRYFTYFSKSRIRRIVRAIPGAECASIWMTNNVGKEATCPEFLTGFFQSSSMQAWLNILIRKK